jgi:hypothetical protein
MLDKLGFITFTVCALLACDASTGCGCSPAIYEAGIQGFVTNNTGRVVDARVTAVISSAACQGAAVEPVYASRDTTVDSTGRYRFIIATGRADTLCARLVAHAGSDSLVHDQVSVVTPSFDSVRVDFTFP